MELEFCSLASGSSGNSYLVRSENTALLVDVGIAGKHILSGLKSCGTEITDIDGILLTHEHTDHVKSIRMMARKAAGARVCGTAGTLRCVEDKLPLDRTDAIRREDTFTIGDITVTSFALSHDAADPCGYTFRHGGRKVSIMTDTGIVTPAMAEAVEDSDILALEANHEVYILKMGPYPYSLKRRILGDHGHLSNETSGRTLSSLLAEPRTKDMPVVFLSHLSKENNTPEQALLTVRNELFEAGIYPGRDLRLEVAKRSEPTGPARV